MDSLSIIATVALSLYLLTSTIQHASLRVCLINLERSIDRLLYRLGPSSAEPPPLPQPLAAVTRHKKHGGKAKVRT